MAQCLAPLAFDCDAKTTHLDWLPLAGMANTPLERAVLYVPDITLVDTPPLPRCCGDTGCAEDGMSIPPSLLTPAGRETALKAMTGAGEPGDLARLFPDEISARA